LEVEDDFRANRPRIGRKRKSSSAAKNIRGYDAWRTFDREILVTSA
jgi:hypothetical protein